MNEECYEDYMEMLPEDLRWKLDIKYSHIHRLAENIRNLKTYRFNKTNTICAVFKAHKKTADETISSIYGFLYSEFEDKLTHKYITHGSTFRSQDGEYRHKMIPFDQIRIFYEKYEELLPEIDEMIVERLNSEKLAFTVNIFYPDSFSKSEAEYEASIDNGRIAIKIFTLAWIYDFYQIHLGLAENHLNPAYKAIIYDPADVKLFEALVDRQPEGTWGKLVSFKLMTSSAAKFTPRSGRDTRVAPLETGQKIIPLTYNELTHLGNIDYSSWREFYIAVNCCNLLINLISPSFSVVNDWFLIQNIHPEIFDNVSMHDKFAQSKIGDDIRDRILRIDKLNYINEKPTIGPINGQFKRLSDKLHSAINYGDSYIRLTPIAVCFHQEHTGRTLRDLPQLAKYESQPAYHLTFNNRDPFARIIFDYLYAILCMNTRIGTIHGDLHLNNATIYRYYAFFDREGNPIIKEPSIAYRFQEHSFVFPNIGIFGVIIDFSRGIISDKGMVADEFSLEFAELYFRDQRTRTMKMINNSFPDFVKKHKDRIMALLLSNFELMFKILSGIDAYSICFKISRMITREFPEDPKSATNWRNKIKVPTESRNLVKRIASYAEKNVLHQLGLAIDGKIQSADDIEWPILRIINEFFSKYQMSHEDLKKKAGSDFTLTEIFDYCSPMKYKIQDYETWPKIVKCNYIHEPLNEDIEVIVNRFKDDSQVNLEDTSWMYE